ncbi:MAG: hypothetical protein JXR81_06230 [Candidatus Goldbacteria bacterium]|jgi:hypothetical protein|nr:hypothetical protein [Candidatus Goldiibacteriota bacterium]PKL90563.1 MAG: hypothetical protein CVV21_12235 [Candidatus Goldiibacteriota bacterium HGW-Goldbacteria-1]
MEEKKPEPVNKQALEADMLKIMQMHDKSAQEKYNAIQDLARKYNMPLEKLLKNIITDWCNEDKEKKFSQKGKFKKIL